MSTPVPDHIHDSIIDASLFLSQLVEEYGDKAEIDLSLSRQIEHYSSDIIDLINNHHIKYEPDFLKLCSLLLIQDFHLIIDADIRKYGNIQNAKTVIVAKCGLFQSWFDRIINLPVWEIHHKGIFFKDPDAQIHSWAMHGHLDCMIWAKANGVQWDKYVCIVATKYGHLDCLKYAHENGSPWSKYICETAAKNGHLDCLKYAHENGCFWNKRTCEAAAKYNHLDCLKYAHENGCSWNKRTCEAAASRDSLECLKYAHINGCHWDKRTCIRATHSGHLRCLKYARVNGCPE